MNQNILSVLDYKDDIHTLIDKALELKAQYKSGQKLNHILSGKRLAQIFERASTRTHASFTYGMQLLGGTSAYFTKEDLGIKKRETIEDIALTLSRYTDLILYRAIDQEDLKTLAHHATVPVINGLDNNEHPCQILSDLVTIKEHKQNLENLNFTFIGDGDDNLTHSYMLGCLLCGMNVTIISPKQYQPNKHYQQLARQIAEEKNKQLIISEDLEKIENSDIVATDTWISYWDEIERSQRLNDFSGYTVTKQLMSKAKADSLFMHCMPIYYDQEVSYEVAHGPQSIIFDEAENRMWAQMALMIELLKNK